MDDQARSPSADTPGESGEGQDRETSAGGSTDEQRAARLREEIKAIHVVDVAQEMMLSLVTLGYQKLGLTDETRDLRNLDDAHLAIELLKALIEQVGAVAGGEQLVAPYRSTLAAMQMNFVRAMGQDDKPSGETGGSEGGEAAT